MNEWAQSLNVMQAYTGDGLVQYFNPKLLPYSHLVILSFSLPLASSSSLFVDNTH
jgi:hypothetical protein